MLYANEAVEESSIRVCHGNQCARVELSQLMIQVTQSISTCARTQTRGIQLDEFRSSTVSDCVCRSKLRTLGRSTQLRLRLGFPLQGGGPSLGGLGISLGVCRTDGGKPFLQGFVLSRLPWGGRIDGGAVCLRKARWRMRQARGIVRRCCVPHRSTCCYLPPKRHGRACGAAVES